VDARAADKDDVYKSSKVCCLWHMGGGQSS
jgi:hypothetical protein